MKRKFFFSLVFFSHFFLNISGQSIIEKEAVILLKTGDSLIQKGENEKSVYFFRKAIEVLENKKKNRAVFETVIEIADKFYSSRDYSKALTLLNDYLEQSVTELGNQDSLTAKLLHKIGVGHYWKRDFKQAIFYYNQALNIRKNQFEFNRQDIVQGYYNIGGCFQEMNQLDSARIYLLLSLQLQPKKPYRSISNTYRVLGRVYRDLGDFSKAENSFLTSIAINKKFEIDYWEIVGEYLDLSIFYIGFELFDKAIFNGKESVKILNSVNKKIREDYLDLVNSLNVIGIAYSSLNDYEQSTRYFLQSIEIAEEFLEENEDVAIVYSNLGIDYMKMNKNELTLKYLNKALEINLTLNLSTRIADTHNNLGDLYYDEYQYQKALTYYHQSLPYFLKNFQEKDAYKNPILKEHYISDKQALLIFLEAKAKTFKALYDQNHQEKDLIAAHQTYQLLDELIDNIRLSYLEDASKSYLVKQAKPIYEKAIGLCLQYYQYSQDQKYLTEAFKYAEKSKAIILLEQIKESRANIAANIPDSLRQKERQLKREIGQIEKQLALQGEEVTTDSLGKSLREQLIRVKNDYEELVKTLEKENSEYHQLKYDLKTIDIPMIQNSILQDGQLLVEYFVGVDSMYLFSIGKADFKVISKPLDFPIKVWIDSLRQGIYYCRVNKDIRDKDCQALDLQYSEFATKLYQKLITPLNLTKQTKEIIFIPDGVLGYIPFDALLTKTITTEQQNQFHHYPYFGLEKVINYSFSATFLKELQQSTSTLDNYDLLAYAPSFKIGINKNIASKTAPILETEDPILTMRSSLSPLLFNETEVAKINALFGGQPYTKKTANKLSFIEEAPNYRYLHIASHGKMNDEDADLSYIAFTQEGDSTNQEELLYLRELYDMDIPADMVVLSACETGIGELQNGEGIISLARGFSYAGAKSIITSLWNVNDQKTADLMVDFYQNLKLGQTKNNALANAKRNYIATNSATFSHPFYWAGFIPIGNMERVQAARDWTWWMVSGLVVVMLGTFLFWRLRRNV